MRLTSGVGASLLELRLRCITTAVVGRVRADVLTLLQFAGNKITTIENLGATEVTGQPDCKQLPTRSVWPPSPIS